MTQIVRATRFGYHGNRRRRPGDVFEIGDREQLGSWMEPVEAEAPAHADVAPVATGTKRGRKPKPGETTSQPVALSQIDVSDEKVDM